MKELINQNQDNVKTIDSREIAKLMGKEHGDLLKDIQGSGKNLGIMPVLLKGNFPVSDYFLESSYKDPSGKENKCYLCTKLGCEMLGNKLRGEKGILFTASYVRRFNEMEKQIERSVLSFQIEDPIERAKAWIIEQEKARQLLAQKDEIIEELSPFAKLARERMDKTGTVSLTDMTKTYELKRGQISCWAKVKGFIHKSITEVNKDGEEYFKCVEDTSGHKSIAIKEEGIKLIDKYIDEIRNSPSRFKKTLLVAN